MLLLDRGALEQALPIEEVISAVEEAFRAYQQGGVEVPLRSPFKTGKGMILYMPALLPNFRGSAILGTKIITVFDRNPQKGLPLIHALYLLFDPTSGRPLALLEGSYLTAMRTGATSAVAARYLARAEAESLGIIEAGYQAFFQAWAISQVRRIERAYLYDQVAE
ncbi:MAG: ornithine cyclodeaminase family protein, partial [Candidatus Bipolaricaulia bacterium]